MSRITDFYLGTGTDARGRTFEQLIALDDNGMERSHDVIQWLFPLPETSQAQPHSPVAGPGDYLILRDEPCRSNLLRALGRMQRFYQDTVFWRRERDHNHHRITRILRCLTLCGMSDVARQFRDGIMFGGPGTTTPKISKQSLWYWQEALAENPAWL